MLQIRRTACALLCGGGLALGAVAWVGCKDSSGSQSQSQDSHMDTYKCSMATCGKTKQAKAGAAAPS